MRKKWHEVDVTAPAVVGLILALFFGLILHPLAGLAAFWIATAPLVAYRILTR